MASASAIPMIAITMMLPKALGLRPTASAALPPTRPTPTPAPGPAKASGSVAAKLGIPPASAASIGRISNIIFPFVLLFLLLLSGSRRPRGSMVTAEKSLMRGLSFFSPMPAGRELDINRAKNCENEGLEQANQQLEEIEWQREQDRRNPDQRNR